MMAVVGVFGDAPTLDAHLNASNASSMATSVTPRFAVDEFHSPPMFIGDEMDEFRLVLN